MKSLNKYKRTGYFSAGVMVLMFVLSACSSDNAQQIVEELAGTVNISGAVISSDNPSGQDGVEVKGVYRGVLGETDPVTTRAAGRFTLAVLEDTPVFVQVSGTGFVTLNSAWFTLSVSETGLEIDLPTTAEANTAIATAFPGEDLNSGAWLAINVVDAAGQEVPGAVITVDPAPDGGAAYTDCDGSNTGGAATIADCDPAREGPMYLAYFTADAEITVSVSGVTDSQEAPVRAGQVTFLEFEQ